MADLKDPKSHPVHDLSDSDTERHPAEALIIRKAEQASSSASLQSPIAREPGETAEQPEHAKAVKQPAVVIAANPALAKARDSGKSSGKAKRKERSRDSRADEADPGEHSPGIWDVSGVRRRETHKADPVKPGHAELASSDSEENGIALGNAPGARGKRQRIVEPVGVTVVEEDEEPVAHAPEMQRLLRQPRYFDEDFEASAMRCFRCGGSGHMSYSCPNAEKLRPCYLCGQFGHSRGQCPNMLCFKCNQPGHLARDCPSGQVSAQLLAPVCLRCGRADCPAAQAGDYVRAEGGCAYDYEDDDMAQARCTLCGRRGHFCCQSTAQLPALQPSCYNCGEGGHTGVECWRDRPNGVVNERRNTAAARGTVVQRSVPALGMDHHYYQGGTAGEPLKHGGFGPQYGGTSYQERVSRMQSRTGEAMGTPYPLANTHVRFDANGDGTGTPGTNRSSRRRYGRR